MKNINDTIDKALDALIDEAAFVVNEKEGEGLSLPDTDIELSQKHKDKMRRFFHKERRRHTLYIAASGVRRIACVILVAVAVMSAAVFSVEAWRVKFLNFIFDADAPNTEINFSDERRSEIYDGMVELEYVPKGFTLEESSVSSRSVSLYFTNKDKYLNFSLNKLTVESALDTEGATVENIRVKGCEGIYISKPEFSMLVWHDSVYAYDITSNMEKSEIIKIAENVKIK